MRREEVREKRENLREVLTNPPQSIKRGGTIRGAPREAKTTTKTDCTRDTGEEGKAETSEKESGN